MVFHLWRLLSESRSWFESDSQWAKNFDPKLHVVNFYASGIITWFLALNSVSQTGSGKGSTKDDHPTLIYMTLMPKTRSSPKVLHYFSVGVLHHFYCQKCENWQVSIENTSMIWFNMISGIIFWLDAFFLACAFYRNVNRIGMDKAFTIELVWLALVQCT